MPEPTNKYSFDSIFTYKFVDLISNETMDPNTITLLNIIPSALALYFLYVADYTFFYIFLIIRIVLDCLDGHVARKYNKTSTFGGLVDHYTDLCFYTGLLILLSSKFDIVFRVLLVVTLIIVMERVYIPLLTELFKIIEDNTIVSVPCICAFFLYFHRDLHSDVTMDINNDVDI